MRASILLLFLSFSLSSCLLFDSNGIVVDYPSKPLGEHKLLQFAPNHAEWIPVQLLDAIINGSLSSDLSSKISKEALAILKKENGRLWGPGYVDVTSRYEEVTLKGEMMEVDVMYRDTIPNYPNPNPSNYPLLSKLFGLVSPANLKKTVVDMSSLHTRFYQSSMSAKAPALVQQKVNEIVRAAKAADIKVTLFKNTGFNQPNVVAIIPAKKGSAHSQEVLVIGGHLDSVVEGSGPDGRAPGADDDASGSSIALETFKLLVSSGWRGSRPVHFMWFAAEEGGLLGSQQIARAYKNQGINVYGMFQLEMCGYQKNPNPVITVLKDPNPAFSNWTRTLIQSYHTQIGSTVEIRESICGYGCSDHNSFDDVGYPAGIISEAGPRDAGLNPYMHSTNDTPDQLNFDAMVPFVKVALAWVVELSH